MNKSLFTKGKIIFIVFVILLAGCTTTKEKITPECAVDSDCVPASCCHSSACVSKEKAPDCSNTFCSMECQKATLDCGQGKCICKNGKCIIKFITQ